MVDTISLIDNFNDNSLSGNWTASGDTSKIFERAGILDIQHASTTGYNQIISTTTYNISGLVAYVEIVDAGNQALASHGAIFFLRKNADDNNKLFFTVTSNVIQCFKVVTGVQTQVGSNVTYAKQSHRWFRFRESGGTIYWDVGPNTGDFNNITSLANPFGTTTFDFALQSGCYSIEASGSYAIFDNFNYPRGQKLGDYMTRPYAFKPGIAR